MNHDHSVHLFNKAKELVAGGVSSQIRANEPAETPLFFTHAKGSKIWDVDGNKYIDYIQGMGPNLFGHSPDFINKQVNEDMQKGYIFSAQFERELEVAEMVLDMIPMKDATVRFASSGTEINQLLFRTMRGFTGRPKILKFEGHYHGWMDSVNWSVHPPLEQAGPEDAPVPVGESAGMDQATADGLVICQWNDPEKLEVIFAKHGPEIAGVIMEPILANTNCIIPGAEFLEELQRLCKEYGSLMAFDEVITGFRIARGGAQEYLGITPDLATYAKSMAGGFPIAMIVGRRDVMDLIGNGIVYHGGSFNSNVMSIAATYASLKYIRDQGDAFYADLNGNGLRLMGRLRDVAKSLDSDLHVQGVGSIFSISFTTKQEIVNWRDHARNCDDSKYQRFACEMLKQGIRLSSNGRIHISSAHTEEDIDKTVTTAAAVLSI